jgi:glucose-6-phosphate dehydrogenase assembly protein OpcA
VILSLPNTTTSKINGELVRMRSEGGAVTLGRVMNLVIDATCCDAESAIRAANEASREHPCRVIVLAKSESTGPQLDAEIRVGGDAGASEVILLRPSGDMTEHADTLVTPLLLPDAPIVAWWPGGPVSAPALTALGAMATRRITEAKNSPDVKASLLALADGYAPGDTDLAWARTTRWRALLAAALEQAGSPPVTHVRIHGDTGSPAVLLLGAWLRRSLGCDFEDSYSDEAEGLVSVYLETPGGEISIVRPDGYDATFSQPGLPDHMIVLPRRTLQDCLAEDLRRLDADEVYGETLIAVAEALRS